MSTAFQPFGMKPAYHPSGLDRSVPFAGTNSFVPGVVYNAPYALSAGQSFYQYTPVAVNSSGQLTLASQASTGVGALRVYGVFDGVEYNTAEGRRTVGKSISLTSLAAANSIVFWIFQDPALVYEIQVNGSVPATAIGSEYNFDTTAGSTVADGYTIGNGGAGFSTTALLATPVATGTQGQVRVVGLGREVAFSGGSGGYPSLNQWGDAYTIVQVQIANSLTIAPSVAA
jgi:hypothetical protein